MHIQLLIQILQFFIHYLHVLNGLNDEFPTLEICYFIYIYITLCCFKWIDK